MAETDVGVPVSRGMDRATLDAAYNNSAAVADSAEWTADWRRRSPAVRAMHGARLDVAYGAKERQRLDYFPAGRLAGPLFAFIHGGYWQRNDKDMFAFVAEGPLAHGINVAMLGYTLAPVARLADIVAEIRQALIFLRDSAGAFAFDSDAIHVGGWSAGGHLTAMACREPTVRSGLAVSGIFELEPIALTYLNEQLHLDRNEIETLSPARVLGDGMAPLHVTAGAGETAELRRQSRSFRETAEAKGLPVTYAELAGHHHFSIIEELAKPDGALTRELVRLVAKTARA
jgi:arylformamidase